MISTGRIDSIGILSHKKLWEKNRQMGLEPKIVGHHAKLTPYIARDICENAIGIVNNF